MNKTHVQVRHKTVFFLEKYFSGETIGYKEFFAIILPIFVDQSFLVIMSLLNTAMISSAGVAAVSAVSMVDSLNIFLINVFIAVATGGTVIVAQYKGSGNRTMVSKTANQAISAVTVISILLCALIICLHLPTLNLLFGHAESDVFHNAKIYLIGSCLSYPFIAVFEAVCGALRGVGETKPCLFLSLLMNLTNTILNVLLITVLHMGIIGLVISVLLARFLGMVASLIYIIKINETLRLRIRSALKIEWSILKKILYIGIPFAAEQMFFNGGKLLTQTFIVQLGTLSITVYAITNSLAWVFQIGPNALGIATVTIVGQCIGRKNIGEAKKFVKAILGLATAVFIAADALIIPLYPLLIKMFHPPHAIIPTIFTLLVISAVAQPLFWSISFILPSALRAAGDSTFTSVTSLLSMWLLRVVLGYILGITLKYGITGVWLAMCIEWSVRGVVFIWRFRGKKWYAHKLID
ncbi:MATE family efflux transporter [Pullulanibacillus sp. KACC 23026]|uniref:MATE family efflux transporter n=1 Tax=Pullulanibacillus sp. KACC 23026 TaxID=3028315 RepID=UPI0023B01F74|nr:MATE family efflux transporter [Pullulanibacillus sp. KACC 23026]WEG10984.1 MATE family efflux transporter [Pullulanibacillus sp. KACC 23026]